MQDSTRVRGVRLFANRPNGYLWVKSAMLANIWQTLMKARRSLFARSLQHSQIWTSCSRLAFSSFPGSHQSRVCEPSTCCYCCWAPRPAKLGKHWTWFWMFTDRSWPQDPEGPLGAIWTEENNSQMKVLSQYWKSVIILTDGTEWMCAWELVQKVNRQRLREGRDGNVKSFRTHCPW